MTTFYVGQPVRIRAQDVVVRKFWGVEAVFLCYGTAPVKFPEDWHDCCIKVNGEPLSGRAEDLEPILPEGHQPAELSVEELLPFLREKTNVT